MATTGWPQVTDDGWTLVEDITTLNDMDQDTCYEGSVADVMLQIPTLRHGRRSSCAG